MLKRYSKIWFTLKFSFFIVVSFVIAQAIVMLGLLFVNNFFGSFELDGNLFKIIITLITYVVTLLFVGLVYFKITKQKISLRDLGFSRLPHWEDIFLVVPVFVTYSLLSSFSIVLLNALFPVFSTSQEQKIGFGDFSGRLEYVLVFLLIAFLTPLFEEILFRGFFLGYLAKKISPKLAIIVVSIIFAMLHVDWLSFPQEFGWGLIFSHIVVDIFIFSLALGFLVKITDGLWASVLLHVLKNSIAFMVLFLFK